MMINKNIIAIVSLVSLLPYFSDAMQQERKNPNQDLKFDDSRINQHFRIVWHKGIFIAVEQISSGDQKLVKLTSKKSPTLSPKL